MDQVSSAHSFSFADIQVIGKNQPGKSDNLQDAVVQFESLFVNMMLKSMRDANKLLAEGSYLNSSEIQMHQQMLDQQMAVHLSEQGGIGLAEPLLRQLGGGMEPDRPTAAEQTPLIRGESAQERLVQPFTAQDRSTLDLTAKPRASEKSTLPLDVESKTQSPGIVELDPVSPAAVAPSNALSFATPMDFVDKLLPTFRAALASSPINPVTALAQAALETGWGAHQMVQSDGKPAHNLFGIKATNWSGPTAQSHTVEFLEGQPIQQQQSFRAYADWSQSVQDYAKLVENNERYTDAVDQAQDPAAYLHGLKDAGYATDPKYAEKILDVLDNIKQMLSR